MLGKRHHFSGDEMSERARFSITVAILAQADRDSVINAAGFFRQGHEAMSMTQSERTGGMSQEEAALHNYMRPCVDCGLRTGNYCDNCKSGTRYPCLEWETELQTPLCTKCENKHEACHYCHGIHWATPPPHGGPLHALDTYP